MTENEARQLLRDCGGFGGLEAWIAEQPWKAAPGGWTVAGRVRGRSFLLEPLGSSLRITAVAPGEVGRRRAGRSGPSSGEPSRACPRTGAHRTRHQPGAWYRWTGDRSCPRRGGGAYWAGGHDRGRGPRPAALLRRAGRAGGMDCGATMAGRARRLDRHRRAAGLALPGRGRGRGTSRQRHRARRRSAGNVGRPLKLVETGWRQAPITRPGEGWRRAARGWRGMAGVDPGQAVRCGMTAWRDRLAAPCCMDPAGIQ
jgi:hypothetical protein